MSESNRDKTEFYERDKEGYQALVHTDKWKVALLGWAERFDRATPVVLERHHLTDETFLLLQGEAWMIEAGNGPKPTKPVVTKLVPLKICNVPKDVWHHVHVSRDGVVTITENEDTCADNTEKIPWEGDVYADC